MGGGMKPPTPGAPGAGGAGGGPGRMPGVEGPGGGAGTNRPPISDRERGNMPQPPGQGMGPQRMTSVTGSVDELGGDAEESPVTPDEPIEIVSESSVPTEEKLEAITANPKTAKVAKREESYAEKHAFSHFTRKGKNTGRLYSANGDGVSWRPCK
jgi:hypothetical protein